MALRPTTVHYSDGGLSFDDVTIENYVEVACSAALRLSSLWKKSKHAKLLLQPPLDGGKHTDLALAQSVSHANTLLLAMDTVPSSHQAMSDFLAALQPYKPAATLAMLGVWLLQQPHQLDLAAVLANFSMPPRGGGRAPCHTVMCVCCCRCMVHLMDMAVQSQDISPDHVRTFVKELHSAGLILSLANLLAVLLAFANVQKLPVTCQPVAWVLDLLYQLHRHSSFSTLPGQLATNVAAGNTLPILLSHVQGCVALLPRGDAPAIVPAAGASSSSSSGHQGPYSSTNMCGRLYQLQMLVVVSTARAQAQASHTSPGRLSTQLLHSSAYAEASLQIMAAHCHGMQQNHTMLQQLLRPAAAAAQQQQVAGSSSQLQQQQQAGQRIITLPPKPLRVERMCIPAAHLQLLPGASYGTAVGLEDAFSQNNNVALSWVLRGLRHHLQAVGAAGSSSPALSVAAVQLTLELQLLAAGHYMRQQQLRQQQLKQQQAQRRQQQQAGDQRPQGVSTVKQDLKDLLVACTDLLAELLLQLKSQQAYQLVLQQSGLQLLQVLIWAVGFAAPAEQQQEDAAAAAECVPVVSSRLLLSAGGIAGSQASNSPVVKLFQKGVLVSPCPLLTSLAAQHPLEYFRFIDSSIRAGLAAHSIFLPSMLLRYGLAQTLPVSFRLLGDPAAVAAVSSAVAGLMKLAVKYTREAAATPAAAGQSAAAAAQSAAAGQSAAAAAGQSAAAAAGQSAAAQSIEDSARQNFSAALPTLADLVLQPLYALYLSVVTACNGSSSSSKSSSNSSSSRRSLSPQVAASAMTLTVLLARSLVVLADAHEAAAAAAGATPAALLAEAVAGNPSFDTIGGRVTLHLLQMKHLSTPRQQWQQWQYQFTWVGQYMVSSLVHLLPASALQPIDAAAAAAPVGDSCSSPGSGSSSNCTNSGQQEDIQWAYMLHLPLSLKLTAALSAFRKKWSWKVITATLHDMGRICSSNDPAAAAAASTSFSAAANMDELYRDMLQLCRVLCSAAPLPLLCNNPGCVNLSGVSEASVAVKVCGGCRVRYCSPACQAAHWRQHKKACRRMAALGLVVGR